MKLIVDKMPETAKECLFAAMGTGKPRCRHDAKLCPLLRGEECPHLMVIHSSKLVEFDGETQCEAVAESIPEPKKRTTKRSTAKKAD